MPTFGWILEDAVERFWERQPSLVLVAAPLPIFTCSHCGVKFSSREELHRHFTLEHPLELPTLYVRGQPLLRESVLRSPIEEDDVELFQCSHCEVQVDGAPWQYFEPPEFRKHFCQSRNATWNVRLIHKRFEDDSQITEEYLIRFRIPDTAALNAVDEHFIQTLVLESLTHSDLDRFEAGLPMDAPSREYGSALGDYALGVMLKERGNFPYGSVGFAEFASKMRTSLEILRHFHRPVAWAVSSSICFNLNNFYDYGTTTTSEIDYALHFFRSVIRAPEDGQDVNPTVHNLAKSSIHMVCPIDGVSHRLLSACVSLANQRKLSLACLDDLQQLMDGMISLSEQDLAKIHVICAEGYLRLTRAADALPHLHAIQFDSSFKDWAQRHLEDISPYEN